jgi:nicotinate-nucleotide adenylyltransferase
MNMAVLGGAFNPPHLGHLLISRQVLDFMDFNQVWLTPCYKHTFEKDLAPVKHRQAMTKMLINSNIKYCGEEIINKLSGDTIELLALLAKKYPEHQFSFIIGTDNLKCFKKWGQWQKLITRFSFLVFPRPGFEYDLKQYGLLNPDYKFRLISHPLLITSNISSTIIRQRIKQKLSCQNLVPKKVKEYMKENNLYY